jgi:hypothetical protein
LLVVVGVLVLVVAGAELVVIALLWLVQILVVGCHQKLQFC